MLTAVQVKNACLTLPMGGAFAHVSDEDKQCDFYCFLISKPMLIKSSSMESALHSNTTSSSFLVTVTELHACQDLSVHVPPKIHVLKLNFHPIVPGGGLGMKTQPCHPYSINRSFQGVV